ncbi:MAG: MmgE/PrpD family protein [Betaproteobacteria bacterium]|nr:MmgE/PrpD family protein [Betaproteobacteria bacterium]
MDRILNVLSDYAVSLTYQELSQAVVHQVKRRVVDTLGCAMGGYYAIPAQIARAHALEVVSSSGSTMLGTRHRSSPELVAFANGVMARYLDFNDTSMSRKGGHPSDNIMAVLAAAEYAGADIQNTIAGIVIAYEVQDRFGLACSDLRDNGWDHVAYVVLASAAGAGRAIGLNKEQMANALALAAVANAGMRQTRAGRLSMWKGCAAPNAARNGVFAALMARRGLTGPEEAFEGPWGFKKQLGTVLKLPAFGGNGEPFSIETDKFKYFPCDYEAQCSIFPALELHKVLNGKVNEIAKIDIETYEHAVEVAADTPDKWNPTTRETADHSIPYVVAVALTKGTVGLGDFIDESIRDPELHALMQKIQVHATEECTRNWPEAFPFRITVTTESGQKHVRDVRYAKGHPRNPMTDQEIEVKFRQLAEPVMGRTQVNNALGCLWHLEDIKRIQELFDLFVCEGQGRS